MTAAIHIFTYHSGRLDVSFWGYLLMVCLLLTIIAFAAAHAEGKKTVHVHYSQIPEEFRNDT